MRFLGIDTSTWRASVGLVEAGRCLAERHEMGRGSHAAALFPMLDAVLADAGMTIDALDGVAVAAGPGSFSGLRVGLSVAKGLALARSIAVVPVPTLAALSLAADAEGPVCSMLDARRGEVYWALFEVGHGVMRRLSEDALTSPEICLSALPADVTVVGDATTAYGELLERRLGGRAGLRLFPDFGPRGGLVAALGMAQLAEGIEVGRDFEPRYIRPSEAELKFG